jgi:hypothetical protein
VSFDFSILEIFAPLLTGGTVILADTVFELPDLPARDDVRMICAAPSALSALLARPLPAGVRTVTIGGALPLTSSGKIDRRVLPVVSGAGPAPVAPRTETEKLVVEAWSEVLGPEDLPPHRISVFDDFFALGGHSLTATRVTAQLSDQLGCTPRMRLLFDYPVLADYAAQVDRVLLEQEK